MSKGSALYDARVDEAALQDAHRDNATPLVQLGHPRKGVWSGKNQLGVELPFELDAQRMQTIFKMDEWGFPEVWTLSLAVRSSELPTNGQTQGTVKLGAGQAFDIIGEISFGAGGIVQTFEVDWVEGTIFSLPMNAINVRARWSALATFFGIAPPPDVRVSVIASRGGIRHARATKTDSFNEVVPAGAFLGGALPFSPIPAFAKSLVLVNGSLGVATDLYNANTILQFFLNESKVGGNLDVVSIPGNFLGPTTSFKVPIPANARFWSILNAGPAPISIGASAIWNLFDE